MSPSLLTTCNSNAVSKTLATTVIALVTSLVIFLTLAIGTISPANAGEDARFLRMGLNKSVAIRLPVPARDVLVGNPDVVEAVVRTRTTAYLFAKKNGQTNIFFFDDAGRQILNLDIQVAADVKALKELLDRTLPGNQIVIDTVADNIILRGVAKSSGEAQQAMDLAKMFLGGGGEGATNNVVSALTIAAREQITLRVRIAEVQRDVLKQLGVDYNAVFTSGSFSASMLTGNPFPLNNILAGPSAAAPGLPGTSLKYGNDIEAFIQAMEQDGLLRTLAEPTLTAISGESANFLAGGEFPVITARDLNNKPTVEYKQFGVSLGFSPVVLSEGRISLKINTEVSEPVNSDLDDLKELKTRRAETVVELPSGGSLIMAGLIEDKTEQNISGIPGAKDLPVLGQLFRSNDFKQNQTELTVMVTPFIVKPVNDRELVTPIDNLSVATDRQRYLFGRLNKVYGNQGGTTKGGSTYHGNVGFIIE